MNPNSANQLWSRWDFGIEEAGRHVSRKDVEYNAAKWIKAGFGTAGQVRVMQTIRGWNIEALIEGRPAHDPSYVESVRRQFQQRFVEHGWGPFARSTVKVKVLAGDVQDGKPSSQLVMVPFLDAR